MPDAAARLPIQLICTDFDGTLFAECDDPQVPLVLQQMIGALQARGAKWVINTGRDLRGLLSALGRPRLSIAPDYLVVQEQDIYVRDNDGFAGVPEWNRANAQAQAALFARVRWDIPRLVRDLSSKCLAPVHEDPGAPFTIVAGDARDVPRMVEYLARYGRTIPGLTLATSTLSARITHERCNKGAALAEIGRQLGISRDFTLAAGDHFNDLPMMSIEVARWLVAPANAIDEVKASVRSQDGYVSHQPCGHGVASGLEFFLRHAAAAGVVAGLTLVRDILR